jgi:hypothetical protein
MTAGTAAFSVIPGTPDLAGQPFADMRTACQVGGDSPPGARQSIHGKGGREWLVQPGTQGRDDCVTAAFLLGWQGTLAAHPPSMARSLAGTESNPRRVR